MDAALLRLLSEITEEEQKILDGSSLDMGLYSDDRRDAVEAAKVVGDARPISIRSHTRFTAFPRHRHDFVEIMYVCQGEITHLVGGKAIHVRAGELIFFGRNTWHEILPAGKKDIGVNFIVRPAFFRTAFDMMEEQNILSDFIIASLAGEGAADEYLYFSVADKLPVQNLVENLVYSLCHPDDAGMRLNEVTMGLLFLYLMRLTDCAQTGGDAPRALALRALRYIDESYGAATLRQFARDNGVPEYTASRVVKGQLGSSFQQLLQDKRFAAARQLLRGSSLSVAEIIAAVGYENTSYFYRVFRERTGMSPQEYRKGPKP